MISFESCFEANKNALLKEWVVEFLAHEGNNAKLSKKIKETTCDISLSEYPLSELKRIAGPEDGMLFPEDQEVWEKRVMDLKMAIENGLKPLPLIVTDFWEDQHISDGCHRHEALTRSGIKRYWVIFLKKRQEQQN